MTTDQAESETQEEATTIKVASPQDFKNCERCALLSSGHEPGRYRCIAHRAQPPEVIATIKMVKG